MFPHYTYGEKVSKQFPSIIEAHEFGNKSSFFSSLVFANNFGGGVKKKIENEKRLKKEREI